jgi:hypothetical protein
MKFLPRVCDPSLFSRLPGTQFPVSMVHSDNVVHLAMIEIRTHNTSGDRH